ncbi:MAG: hypothetical protein A3J73_07475 [Planctomycetes bacterium RIFCSPHIGHO2_02_FULL_38_41]|nr:MAG: hypothetical protein A3J73_07475 [Planctomycetes bacterium RIFCSPHIGHO2_02_FULL_38_41]OHB90960.1 MAG: hypothetical protein A2Z57_13070 [Planctomycetes bacterium RIFCSPHIGHO2_12_39_6]OHB98446.1 MAG: hypothetical protein A2W74_04070 [Planctomycetes bacterium RIFCSPLOWO2_12_38_17]
MISTLALQKCLRIAPNAGRETITSPIAPGLIIKMLFIVDLKSGLIIVDLIMVGYLTNNFSD